MRLFNIGMVLDWAKGQNDLRGCNSVIIKKALDEYAALLKAKESTEKSDNKSSFQFPKLEEVESLFVDAEGDPFDPEVIKAIRIAYNFMDGNKKR